MPSKDVDSSHNALSWLEVQTVSLLGEIFTEQIWGYKPCWLHAFDLFNCTHHFAERDSSSFEGLGWVFLLLTRSQLSFEALIWMKRQTTVGCTALAMLVPGRTPYHLLCTISSTQRVHLNSAASIYSLDSCSIISDNTYTVHMHVYVSEFFYTYTCGIVHEFYSREPLHCLWPWIYKYICV